MQLPLPQSSSSSNENGVLPDAPIWGDVETFEPTGAAKTAEALLAGFPCQVDA